MNLSIVFRVGFCIFLIKDIKIIDGEFCRLGVANARYHIHAVPSLKGQRIVCVVVTGAIVHFAVFLYLKTRSIAYIRIQNNAVNVCDDRHFCLQMLA